MTELDRRTAIAAMAGGMMVGSLPALAAERRVLKASISLEGNRVLIAVGMNGQGPFIFMIDTGQYVSMIRPDLAKQLKLPVQGYERTGGITPEDQAAVAEQVKQFNELDGVERDSLGPFPSEDGQALQVIVPIDVGAGGWEALGSAVDEMHSILDDTPDGLDDYRVLIPQLPGLLEPGGVAVLEIGHTQAEAVTAIAAAAGLAAELHCDLGGRPRALVLRSLRR